MEKRGEGRVNRHVLEGTMQLAYNRALVDFRRKHDSLPNLEVTTFQGGFTDREIVFEIIEHEA